MVVSDGCCKINKPDYAPVIKIGSTDLNIYPLKLIITAKRIVCDITVYDFKTPKSGPKTDKFLVTLDLMSKNESSKNFPSFYLFKPDILLQLKDSDHQAVLHLEEFFVNMKAVYKISEPYGGDKMMENPNPKKPHFKNYHQMVATVLTFDNNLTVKEQVIAENKKVIYCIMSDAF